MAVYCRWSVIAPVITEQTPKLDAFKCSEVLRFLKIVSNFKYFSNIFVVLRTKFFISFLIAKGHCVFLITGNAPRCVSANFYFAFMNLN